MRWILFFFLLMVFAAARSNDSVRVRDPLKGYKKLFYHLVTKHPKINSPLERALLRHYLAGSGVTFLITDEEFTMLQIAVKDFSNSYCNPLKTDSSYCSQKIVLDNDVYFGWGLGTITCIFDQQTKQLITFADVYDFNKKKKGQRYLKSEIVTRIFRWVAPRSAKAFVVSYGTAAYSTMTL